MSVYDDDDDGGDERTGWRHVLSCPRTLAIGVDFLTFSRIILSSWSL